METTFGFPGQHIAQLLKPQELQELQPLQGDADYPSQGSRADVLAAAALLSENTMTDYAPTIILVISPRFAWDSSASSPGKRPKQRTGWKCCLARDYLLASLVHPGIIFCRTSNPHLYPTIQR